MKAPLQEKYDKEVAPMLKKELKRTNPNDLPQLVKITVNVGVGKLMTQGSKDYSFVEENIARITGQKPSLRKARISISNFKLREGVVVGVAVTLRGRRMYDFIEKLVSIALPRVRDFQGVALKGFDGKGNFSLGMRDCTIFPEVGQDVNAKTHGLQMNICTTAKNDHEAYMLLKALGFPFKGEITAKND